ncbi:MAG TPA: bifunctional UDP-sugar hydrolase/5'-nucleotidase [Candidatus Udaeobacter sp.]|nr:bifunctional UDP-sugar hydrolase/5'-nucleotidase [Candidatus Udaeobacter sp.]
MFLPSESWTRRNFLKLVGRAGLISAVPNLARAAATLNSETVCISILHTTDLHGHILPTSDYDGNPDCGGMARCITQIRRWQHENPNSILIDVGDVYQGTDVGLRSKGELMIDLFNYLKYDAWIIGNHEFDWGMQPFQQALQRSAMPVLAANTVLEGKPAGEFPDAKHPFAKIRPFVLKQVAGIKLAIIGVTTPGMPFWLRPEFTHGIDFQYSVEPVRRSIARAKSEGADAIVLTGHMGLKPRSGGDDFANTVMALTSEFPEASVFIAGHTHQLIPIRLLNGALFTQADHFGIHVGRVDLFFDRNSRKLLHRAASCELMDHRIGLDPVVMSRAKTQLAESDVALSQPIGELAETLCARGRPGVPSDIERLIGAAIMEALLERSVQLDGAMHGAFDEKANLVPGSKIVKDIWNVIPFENYVVTAALSPDEIKAVMEEVYASHESRNLLGFEIKTEGRGYDRHITSMTLDDGRPLDRGKKYVIAFNSFDSRSAGHRFMKLRGLLETRAANCTMHPVQTRDALIDYFRRHKLVHRIATARDWATAA